MTFAPPATILDALLCGLVPAFGLPLICLFAGPTSQPGRRMRLTAIVACAAWIVVTAVSSLMQPTPWTDVVAGGLILLAAMLASLTVWSLLAWGFTATLLTTLADAPAPLTPTAWVERYTRGGDIDVLARNRVMVLLALGLASEDAAGLKAAGAPARIVAGLARICRRLFGTA